MEYIREAAKELKLKDQYDVIVAGGGFGGVCAAVSAARQGARVLLLEREYTLGGLATLGLITIYEPICDGMGHQVSFSLAEETFRLSISHGYEDEYPKYWLEGGTVEQKAEKRFRVRFNASMCGILMEKWLKENRVDLLYGTVVCNTILEDNKIKALVVENKSGRSAYGCKSVVDCTGDADLIRQSGEDFALFQQKNVLAGWHYALKDGKVILNKHGKADKPDKLKTEEERRNPVKRYPAIEAEELNELVMDAHEFVLADFLKGGELSPDHLITSIATIPQVRMTRRVAGAYTMDDSEERKYFEDSIGMIGNWHVRGPIYEIPFGTLHGRKVKNLITAGRSISCTDAMWDLTRVIPACAVTGEAAGVAAALTDDFTTLDVKKVQEVLVERGVKLHIGDLNL